MKFAAAILTILLALMLFQTDIKAHSFTWQMRWHISQLDLAPEQETEFVDVIKRIAKGYQKGLFNDVERSTLLDLRAETEAGDEVDDAGASMDAHRAGILIDRFRIIAERYDL